MDTLTLVIGSKNYSSWSFRPWLALTQAGLPFDEILVPLGQPDTAARIAAHSPSGRVPALRHGAITVWDSLAILEYLAETFPAAKLWLSEVAARAVARAVAAEMHGGFAALRSQLSMRFRDRQAAIPLPEDVAKDVSRVLALWQDCRSRFGQAGPFLFGAFSAADCMYAPVVSRFETYAVPVPPVARAYMSALEALPAWSAWGAAAATEPPVARYEPKSSVEAGSSVR